MSLYNDMEYQRQRHEFAKRLAILYLRHPQAVAIVCDEAIDVSGSLLGDVRSLAHMLSQPTYTKLPEGKDLNSTLKGKW